MGMILKGEAFSPPHLLTVFYLIFNLARVSVTTVSMRQYLDPIEDEQVVQLQQEILRDRRGGQALEGP